MGKRETDRDRGKHLVGRNIAAARSDKGLTQVQLGSLIGYTQVAVWRWEAGRVMPSTDALRGLAEALDVTVEWLLAEHAEPIAA